MPPELITLFGRLGISEISIDCQCDINFFLIAIQFESMKQMTSLFTRDSSWYFHDSKQQYIKKGTVLRIIPADTVKTPQNIRLIPCFLDAGVPNKKETITTSI